MVDTSDHVPCDLFDNVELCDTVIIVKRVFASISLLGCLLMLTIIIVYKKHSNFLQRIILYMTIAALLSALAYIMGDLQREGTLCSFQGFAANFADWSLVLWILIITVTLYLYVVKDQRLDSKEWVFHILCWGIPLVVSCIPFIKNHYGPSGAWCWIDNTYWRFGTWYIPLFIMLVVIILLNSHMIYLVRWKVRNTGGIYSPETALTQQRILEEVKPLRWYPAVYLLLNVFPLVNRIQNAAAPHDALFVLTLLHAISVSSQGTLNAIVFGFNKQTLFELRWSNFKVAVGNLFSNQRTVIGEYDVQEDHPIADGDALNAELQPEQK